MKLLRHVMFVVAMLALFATGTVSALADYGGGNHGSFLNSLAASPSLTASTVPSNGDGNPYGVAVVPNGFPSGGSIRARDILVSNFNNSNGKQGQGTTIVAVTPAGAASTFFTAPPSLAPVGLSTALVALRSGVVVVGNTPTTDGTPATVSDGSLIFIDKSGRVLLNLKSSTLLQGPWDMTADDSNGMSPTLFVSNVLSGTITRINVRINQRRGRPVVTVTRMVQIASGFLHRTDPNALLVGPTGLLLGGSNPGHRSGYSVGRAGEMHHPGSGNGGQDSLYVADTGSNRIQVLRHVFDRNVHDGTGKTVVSGGPLEGPLALAWSPSGTIVTSNGDAAGPPQTPQNINRVVEFNPRAGRFVTSKQLDSSGTPGGIFGIAIARVKGKNSLVYVNDNSNSLIVLPQR